ncbi:MAG: ornithine cyclodeaminase family protein, partial [Chlamydiales bacterium]|nr:ornithine cyclodeaminase family protein [Chlamydiales bacterium]
MQWMNLSQIKAALNFEKALKLQEEGFELYSTGKVTLPPVGYMNFGKEGGDLHIKCGWIQGDSVFAVKIAGAFYQNPKKHQLPSLQGVILVFDASTGRLSHLLQ